MDLHEVMSSHDLLQTIARDMHDDTCELHHNGAKKLIGEGAVDLSNYPIDTLKQTLLDMAHGKRSLWQLQYAFLVCVYLSDSVVNWLATIIPQKQLQFWFDGHDTLCGFRERFEYHLLGKFSKKTKKGARKNVVLTATTPQMAAIEEFSLAHMIVTWDAMPYNINTNSHTH